MKNLKFDGTIDLPKSILYNGAPTGETIDDILKENNLLSLELLKVCFKTDPNYRKYTAKHKKIREFILTNFAVAVVFIATIIALKYFIHII